ncbi:hypothetical protein ABK040_005102 [Willaertia magna]
MQEREEERQIKKRKNILKHYFNLEILFEITKYFNDPKDYIYFAETCKYFYETMLIKENYLFKHFNEIVFNNIELILTNDLPEYLFKLKKLHINSYYNDYDILQKFTNLISLKTNNLSGKYLQHLPNLEELMVNNIIYNINENSFTNLKQLKVLTINSYFLQDEWLKNLTNLTQLSTREESNLTGDCLQYFKNLTYLKFKNSSEINDEMLLNCKQLKSINVTECDNIYGNCFKELKELKHLSIKYCDNVNDDDLNNLNNLESLKIKDCENIIRTCLQNLKQLQSLTFNINDITQLQYLNHLINLKHLDIEIYLNKTNNENINNNTGFLIYLVNLEKLFLETRDFIYRDKDFYNLKNLKILKISSTTHNFPEFTGKRFQYFTKLEKLYCNIEINYLNYLTNINYLNLKNIHKDIDFNTEFSHLKKLEKLKLYSALKINMNDDLNSLQIFTNLKHLKIQSSTINGNFNNLQNLTTLELQNLKIKDKQIMNLENLTTLTINKCSSITGKCFLNLKQLKNLVIDYCYDINFKYLSNLKKIIDLNVSGSEIEDKDLMELKNLKYLNVSKCYNLESGIFLLNMNKLLRLCCLDNDILGKIEIDKLKDEIKKGNTLNDRAVSNCML